MLTLVRDGLTHSPWPLHDLCSSDPTSDFLGIKVHLRACTLSLLNVYVPPFRSSSVSRTRTFNPSLLPSSPTTFIFGDLNARHPSWDLQGPLPLLALKSTLGFLLLTLKSLTTLTFPLFSTPLLARGLPLTSVLPLPL